MKSAASRHHDAKVTLTDMQNVINRTVSLVTLNQTGTPVPNTVGVPHNIQLRN